MLAHWLSVRELPTVAIDQVSMALQHAVDGLPKVDPSWEAQEAAFGGHMIVGFVIGALAPSLLVGAGCILGYGACIALRRLVKGAGRPGWRGFLVDAMSFTPIALFSIIALAVRTIIRLRWG